MRQLVEWQRERDPLKLATCPTSSIAFAQEPVAEGARPLEARDTHPDLQSAPGEMDVAEGVRPLEALRDTTSSSSPDTSSGQWQRERDPLKLATPS